MRIKTKINFKKYFSLAIASTLFCLAFARSKLEILAIIVLFVATCINQLMLLEAVTEMVTPVLDQGGVLRKWKIVALFVGKLLLLFSALGFGIHIMGGRVIIPVLNYVVQIFVLGISFNHDPGPKS